LIPSLEDIKDGLLKMILFTNLKELKMQGKEYHPFAVLKLTSEINIQKDKLTPIHFNILKLLKEESEENNFIVMLNNKNLIELAL